MATLNVEFLFIYHAYAYTISFLWQTRHFWLVFSEFKDKVVLFTQNNTCCSLKHFPNGQKQYSVQQKEIHTKYADPFRLHCV